MPPVERPCDQRLTLSLSSPLLEHSRENPLNDFARSAAYSAVQSPIKALMQPVDRALGTSLEKATTFMEPAKEAKFNSTEYWAQQGGHAVGMLGTFWVASQVAKGTMRHGLTEQQLVTRLGQRGVLGLSLKEAALTGFLHDSILRPTDPKDTRSFISSRLGSGFNGALTMTTLTATSIGLKGMGLKNEFAKGIIAGLPAGFVSAHTDSFLRTGNLASRADVGKSMVTMSVLGGGFGAYHQLRGKHESGRSNFEWSEKDQAAPGEPHAVEYRVKGGEKALNEALRGLNNQEPATLSVQQHLGPATGLKGLLGFQRYGPEQALLIQHGPKVDAKAAGTVDLVASCNLEPALKSKAVVDSPSVFLRAGQNRINIDVQAQPIRVGERAATVLEQCTTVARALLELQATFESSAKFRAEHPDLEYHSLPAYAKALQKAGYATGEFLGAGFESVAFALKDGTVLKITRTAELPGAHWNDSWGKRSFDAKIKGEVRLLETEAGEIAVYRQPKVEMGGIEANSPEFKAFMRKVRGAGEVFWDGDYAGDQVGRILDPATGDYVLRQAKSKSGVPLKHEDGSPRMIPVVGLIDYPSVAVPGEHP